LIVHHALSDYCGPISGGTELENLFGHAFQLFLQLDKISVADANTTEGGLPNFPGSVSSAALGSVPGASVSMFIVQRWVKKSLAATSTEALGSAAASSCYELP
jgi:hypothetical protein